MNSRKILKYLSCFTQNWWRQKQKRNKNQSMKFKSNIKLCNNHIKHHSFSLICENERQKMKYKSNSLLAACSWGLNTVIRHQKILVSVIWRNYCQYWYLYFNAHHDRWGSNGFDDRIVWSFLSQSFIIVFFFLVRFVDDF